MIKNKVIKLRYPNARESLLWTIAKLSSTKYQKETWGKGSLEPLWDLDCIYDRLYNDVYGFEAYLRNYTFNQNEMSNINKFILNLENVDDNLQKKYGKNYSQHVVLEEPEWENIVLKAQALLKLMMENNEKNNYVEHLKKVYEESASIYYDRIVGDIAFLKTIAENKL